MNNEEDICKRCGDKMEKDEDTNLYFCFSCQEDRREEYELPRDVKTGLNYSNYF